MLLNILTDKGLLHKEHSSIIKKVYYEYESVRDIFETLEKYNDKVYKIKEYDDIIKIIGE